MLVWSDLLNVFSVAAVSLNSLILLDVSLLEKAGTLLGFVEVVMTY